MGWVLLFRQLLLEAKTDSRTSREEEMWPCMATELHECQVTVDLVLRTKRPVENLDRPTF